VNAQPPAELYRNLTRRVGTVGPEDVKRQPIYKLHGSIDWRDGSEDLFVMGGGKESYIDSKPLLKHYFKVFKESLPRPNARFGYGWADDHVNRMILDAAKTSSTLGIFHVHPNGRNAVDQGNTAPVAHYSAPTLSSLKCIGESRRPLSSTFAHDSLERDKLMRFFRPSATA
jgi:hypothetical protein